ncbi:hypothetical protein AK95_09715 [Paenibacillus sp. LC231]|uniref:hypothetical protein n=1 Tax=Paenibacillus sp. LC231 TaxID=1120679 RepID=UPI0008DD06FB|nr:hypothetical protein [Paenibacillus sp. LC231]OIB03881.1 hypothetical protein AK95_09715 [Paenibacillus sp. LC231]
MWENIETGYYITLESCYQEACDGEKVIDEIINHYEEESEGKNGLNKSWIIIDTYFLSMNLDEYMRFRRKAQVYRNQGFDIDETF